MSALTVRRPSGIVVSSSIWAGEWPTGMGPATAIAPCFRAHPAIGVPVVYYLYDSQDHDADPAYIGSTDRFAKRMREHLRFVAWMRWEAVHCESRKDAYRLEACEIESSRPRLNIARPVVTQ